MGFWSALKKIGSIAAPVAGVVAAPFTGGASIAGGSALGKILSGVGQVAGAAAGASSEGRQQDALYNLNRDKLVQDRYQQDLENKATLPKTFAHQAVVGDVMGKYGTGTTVPDVWKANNYADLMKAYSSATPSYQLSDTAKQAYGALTQQAMKNLLNPTTAPEISQKAEAGLGEKILGGVGLGSALGSAVMSGLPMKKKANTYTSTPGEYDESSNWG